CPVPLVCPESDGLDLASGPRRTAPHLLTCPADDVPDPPVHPAAPRADPRPRRGGAVQARPARPPLPWGPCAAAVPAAAGACLAGKLLARPKWAIEGTLLYTRMPLPERHRGVLELPSLTTYALWVKDRSHLETVCREFGITSMTPDEFGE